MDQEKFKSVIERNLFPIVPLVGNSKIPKVSWSNEKNQIKTKEEFEEIPNKRYTGFSLLCGKVSGVMVIDVDRNHGDGSVDGIKSFGDLIKDLPKEDKQQIFNTFSVNTPNGGVHLYFKYKEGLKNKANYVEGVDVRTDGGLIVLPGSTAKAGDDVKEYRVHKNNGIADMPQALFDKLQQLDKPHKIKEINSTVKNTTVEVYKEGSRNQELFKEVIGIVSKSSIRDITTISSLAKGLNLLKCIPPLDDTEINNIVGSIMQRLNPTYCDAKGNINNWALVQYILKDNPSYTKGNLWFLYNTEKGFYEYMELKEVQRMYFKYALNDKDKTVTRSKNFAELLMLNSEDARSVHDEKLYINCLNGIIDINKNELVNHDPKFKTEIQFQANYIANWEEAFNNSEFKKFLYDVLDEGSVLTLQEAWGLMLSPHSKEVQNCFIYKGEGSNGKSVAFEIQESLINDNRHICSIGLGDFGGDFVISVAEGKHVNIVRDDELSGKTVHKSFKSMVCGEPVLVNRKNKDLVRLGFNMTMFFGLNRMPSAADKSTGFFRRPIVIPFNTSFGTEKEVKEGLRDKIKDTQIADRIIANELDVVFMWAYEGLQRVKANRWKVTVSDAAEREMEEYRQEVDSAYAFFREEITVQPRSDKKLSKSEVYNAYNSWCIKNNYTPMNNVHFGRQFSSYGIKSKASNSVRYWMDIEFINLKEVDEESPFL